MLNTHVIRFKKMNLWRGGVALILAGMLPEAVLAQQNQADLQQLDAMASTIGVGVNVLFLAIFAGILLIARRDMKGWSQPIKWVWFSFSGRLNRKAYWLKGFIPVSMINTGMQLFAMLIGLMVGDGAGAVVGGIALLLVVLPFFVFSIWVGLAITVKRFHDLGSSGWWILGIFIPFYNIWLAIKLAFFRGTIGANKFGDDPIDPVSEYIAEMTGGRDDEGEGEAAPQDQPQPQPPEDGGDAPKGFGAKKFTKPAKPDAAQPDPEEDFTPAEMSGGSANMDVIKRRLGDDIMRPIRRKGGGGRDAQD